jgi:hypothetical protein
VSRIAATRKRPALPGFRQVLRLWYEHLSEILPVALALGAAITADEGAQAYHDRMRAWHGTLRTSITALADAGRLRREWTVDQATDWVWGNRLGLGSYPAHQLRLPGPATPLVNRGGHRPNDPVARRRAHHGRRLVVSPRSWRSFPGPAHG